MLEHQSTSSNRHVLELGTMDSIDWDDLGEDALRSIEKGFLIDPLLKTTPHFEESVVWIFELKTSQL
jgi:hypothetical protein